MESSKLAYELCRLFDNKITAFYRETYKGTLGKVQVELLNYLYENHNQRAQDISHALNIPKQHTSKIILKFQEIGLVESIPDPSDKRARFFSLTESGQCFVSEHISESNKHFDTLIQKLNDQEQKEMAEAMQTMVYILEKL